MKQLFPVLFALMLIRPGRAFAECTGAGCYESPLSLLVGLTLALALMLIGTLVLLLRGWRRGRWSGVLAAVPPVLLWLVLVPAVTLLAGQLLIF